MQFLRKSANIKLNKGILFKYATLSQIIEIKFDLFSSNLPPSIQHYLYDPHTNFYVIIPLWLHYKSRSLNLS